MLGFSPSDPKPGHAKPSHPARSAPSPAHPVAAMNASCARSTVSRPDLPLLWEQGMSSSLDVIAMLLLPMAIIIAAYALAIYLVRLRQMQGVEVCPFLRPLCP